MVSDPNDGQGVPPSYYGDGNENPFRDQREDSINVGDQYELLTKFAMEQRLAHYGYGPDLDHINKNLLFTNLSRQHGETDRVVKMLEIVTILKRHKLFVRKMLPTGKFEEIEEAGTDEKLVAREIYIDQELELARFKNLINYFSTKLYGLTSSAAGSDAKLLQILKSTFLHKEQTIEDRTATNQGFWARMKKGGSQGGQR